MNRELIDAIIKMEITGVYDSRKYFHMNRHIGYYKVMLGVKKESVYPSVLISLN